MRENEVHHMHLESSYLAFQAEHSVSTNKYRSMKPFLRGPVDWEFLKIAAHGSGKTLNVAIAIWHLRTLSRSDTVRICNKTMKDMNLSRSSILRGLLYLEKSGLATVERHKGRKPKVTFTANLERDA